MHASAFGNPAETINADLKFTDFAAVPIKSRQKVLGLQQIFAAFLPIRFILSSAPSCLMRASWCSKRMQATITQLYLHGLHIRCYSTHVLNKLLTYYHNWARETQLHNYFFSWSRAEICSKNGCLAHLRAAILAYAKTRPLLADGRMSEIQLKRGMHTAHHVM